MARKKNTSDEEPYEDEEDFDDEDDSDDEDEEQSPRKPAAPSCGEPDPVRAYLEGQSREELLALLLSFVREEPAVARKLQANAQQTRSKSHALVRQAMQEIRKRTAERSDGGRWGGRGLSDYSMLQEQLEGLLAAQQHDALLDLGRELFEKGMEQVEQSDDEGETESAIQDCLKVVYKAVPLCSRSDADKLLFVIDLLLDDEFELSEGARELLEREWPREAWSRVADILAARLRDPSASATPGTIGSYRRDARTNLLAEAMEKAGRGAEVLDLLEAEASTTGSYERLVRRLIDAGRVDEAVRQATEGLARCHDKGSSGRELLQLLREIAGKRQDWPLVAAYDAEDFFRRPTVGTFQALLESARKAGCETAVRAAALRYLETGQRPGPGKPRKGAKPSADWPLPPLPAGGGPQKEQTPQPEVEVLMELAIVENRPDDVLRWYDRYAQAKPPAYLGGVRLWPAKVADAVARTHPQRAAELYRQLIQKHIDRTTPSAYQEARPYLQKLRDLLVGQRQTDEWNSYLADLRTKNARRRRLMEVLDRLESAKKKGGR